MAANRVFVCESYAVWNEPGYGCASTLCSVRKNYKNKNKDTETLLTNAQRAAESGLERVEGSLNAHIAGTTKQVYSISQEVNFRIRTMMADLVDHKNQTEAFVNAIRQEFLYVKE